MLQRIGRLLYYSLFFLTPLIVLPSTSELFEFNKIIFIYFAASTVGFIWALYMIRTKQIIIKKTFLDIPVLVFLGSQVLSTLVSIDRHTSLFGYYGRFNGGLLSLLSYLVLYYGLFLFFTKKDIVKLLAVSLISSLVVMLWGLPGRFGFDLSCLVFAGHFNNSCWTEQFRPAERMFSTLGQPNWLGAYLAVHFFIGLYFLFTRHLRRWYLMYGYLLLTFTCLLFTRSRSALIGVFVGVLLYGAIILWLKRQEIFKRESKRLIGLGVLFFLSVLVFKTGIDKIDNLIQLPRNNKQEISKLQQTKNQVQLSSEVTESLDIRRIVWKGAINLGLKYPLFGTGVETFAYSYNFTRPQEHNLTSEWDYIYNKAHNEYLNYLATTGFLGFISYVALIVFILKKFQFSIFNLQSKSNDKSSNDQLLSLSLLCSYVTILITNFFGFSTTTISLFFYFIPGLMVLSNQTSLKEYFFTDHRDKMQNVSYGIVMFVYLFSVVWLVMVHFADTRYALGNTYVQNGDYVKAYTYFEQAIKLRREPLFEDKQSYIVANVAFIASYQGEKDLTNKLINSSELYNLRSLKSSPKNVQYWKTRVKNNLLFYQIKLDQKYLEEAMKAADFAKTLAPTDPKLPYMAAILSSVLSEELKDAAKRSYYQERSISEIENALVLKPNYEEAKELKQKLLEQYGKTN